MIGQQLYRLTARDLQLTPLELVWRSQLITQNAPTITITYTVPKDRVLIIHHGEAQGVADGATSVQRLQIAVTYQVSIRLADTLQAGGAIPGAIGYSRSNLAIGAAGLLWDGEVYCPPESLVQGTASFGAAGAGNNLQFGISGIFIPRGNFSV